MRIERLARATGALLLIVFASPLALAAPPTAAPAAAAKPKTLSQTLQGTAKNDFEAAKVLVNDGDYAGAFVKFQSAYDASKDPRLLWNMAACQKNLRKYTRATELLKKYAGDPSPVLTPQDRQEANDLIKTLEPFTTAVTIVANEVGADILVDEVNVGKAPLAGPVPLDIGDHVFRARKDGFREGSITRAVGTGQPKIELVLQREMRESKLVVVAPPEASIELDNAPIGQAQGANGLARVVAAGRHVVRATVPGRAPAVREVTVAEGETRTLEIAIDGSAPVQLAELRIAVGCADGEARGPEEGLQVYLDGSPSAVVPYQGKRKIAEGGDRTVLEHVSFRVTPGVHRVLVRTAECKPLEAQIDVPLSGAEVRGTLESQESSVVRGPAGLMSWGRLAVALWLPSEFQSRSDGVAVTNRQLDRVLSDRPRFKPSGVGVLLSPGFVTRWSEWGLDLGYAGGSVEGESGSSAVPLAANVNAGGSLSHYRAAIRGGPRFPFHYVSFTIPLGIGYDFIDVKNLPTGLIWQSRNQATTSVRALFEAYPLCDLGIFGSYGFEAGVAESQGVVLGQSIAFGVAWQPNPRCRAERSHPVGLSLVQLGAEAAQPGRTAPAITPAAPGVVPAAAPPSSGPTSLPPPPPR